MKNRLNFPLRLLFGFLLCLGLFTLSAAAATLSVDNTTDNAALTACTSAANDCSLRGAIAAAADGDTINFAAPPFDSAQTITLANSSLNITKSLTISGTGARLLTVRRDASSQNTFEVFYIAGGATVTLSGMTVTGGSNGGIVNLDGFVRLDAMNISGNSRIGGGGGGIRNLGDATLTIINSLVSRNSVGDFGAGIVNNGIMNIANTSVINNEVTGGNTLGGGGIHNAGFGTLNLNNVTVANNQNKSTNPDTTGGIFNSGIAVNIRNTLVSANSVAAGNLNPEVRGTFVSNGNNLISNLTGSTGFLQLLDIVEQIVQLDALQDNGGQTDTSALLIGSRAIDAGNNCVLDQTCAANNPPVALTFDQRGILFPRPNGAAVDIGAFELQAPTAAGTTVGGRVKETNGRGIFRALVTMTDSQGNQRQAYTNQQGFYRFENVPSGQVYVFTAQHRRYQFDQPTQVQFVGEENDGINFTGTTNGVFRFDIWNLPTKRIE